MIRDVVSVRDKTRIHYRRLGQGPGMVLLHGYPQTGHMWRKVMPALAERFTVVAPDLRGYGDSDRPVAGYDKRSMAADVADVIRALGIQPVVLVGHDRGARVAHRFALDHAALLTRLVLLDIAPTYDVFARTDQVSARARWHWFFHQLPDLPEALTAGREEIYLRYMYRTSAYNPAAIEEEVRAINDKLRAVPPLVLWGAAGGRRPQVPDMLGVWKERCEHVEGHPVPGSGHFIPEEQPAAVVDAVLKFAGPSRTA